MGIIQLKANLLYFSKFIYFTIHRKKKVREFPVPSRDVTTKLSLGGNNDVTTKLFLSRGSLVSDIPAGDGKLVNLFLRCREGGVDTGQWTAGYDHMNLYSSGCPISIYWLSIDILLQKKANSVYVRGGWGGGGGGVCLVGGRNHKLIREWSLQVGQISQNFFY